MKKGFRPDIVFIDYLNICSSQRYKAGSNANSYTIVKAIAEELRGLAGKHDLPIISATQTNRGGYNSSDMELTDTSESFGLPATADLMLGLSKNEELEQMGQILVKQPRTVTMTQEYTTSSSWVWTVLRCVSLTLNSPVNLNWLTPTLSRYLLVT